MTDYTEQISPSTGNKRPGDAWRDVYAMQRQVEALQRLVRPAEIITDGRLPENPYDGQEVLFLADDTNGILWHFKYRADSTSIYKWEAVGRQNPLMHDMSATAQQSTTSASYADLSTAGPTVRIPLAGDYDVTISASMINTTAGQDTYMGYEINGTATDSSDAMGQRQSDATSGGNIRGQFMKRRRKTALPIGSLVAKYKVTSGTGRFESRTMEAFPIRVG